MGLPTRQALELFELMKQIGVRPTYITFKSVLSARVHAGLVEQGRSRFRSMVSDFGVEPRVDILPALWILFVTCQLSLTRLCGELCWALEECTTIWIWLELQPKH